MGEIDDDENHSIQTLSKEMDLKLRKIVEIPSIGAMQVDDEVIYAIAIQTLKESKKDVFNKKALIESHVNQLHIQSN